MSQSSRGEQSSNVNRGLTMAVLCALTMVVVWVTWPRPDLTIRVQPGGSAWILPRFASRWRAAKPLPLRLDVKHGALVRVVNEDTVWARLGLFAAPPHSDEVARGPEIPGTFVAYCSAHPGKRIVIVIR